MKQYLAVGSVATERRQSDQFFVCDRNFDRLHSLIHKFILWPQQCGFFAYVTKVHRAGAKRSVVTDKAMVIFGIVVFFGKRDTRARTAKAKSLALSGGRG